MAAPTSRLPYLLTAATLALLVVVAWVGQGTFTGVVVGSEAPDFAYPTLDGDTVALADHEGKVVLVNVWATWCAPCRREMPSMERLYRRLEGEDFEILAVSVDARSGETDDYGRLGGDLREFAESLDLTFPILHDVRGRIQRTYQTTGVPESFVVGRDGRIYKKVSGETEWDSPQNEQLIRRLLAEGRGPEAE